MTDESDDPPRVKRGPSRAQINANRRNAQRSTGPRTAAGKARSATNATKHGAYLRAGMTIRNGPFAEDRDEVMAFLTAIVAALAPRDALERTRAIRIAQLHLTERRLDAMEGLKLNTDGILGAADQSTAAGDFGDAALTHEIFDEIVDLFQRRVSDPSIAAKGGKIVNGPFRPKLLAATARKYIKQQLHIPGIWDDLTQPTDADSWMVAFWAVMDGQFKSCDEVERWAYEQKTLADLRGLNTAHVGGEIVSSKSLETMDKLLAMRAKTTRELVVQLAIYETLKARPDDEVVER